MGSYRDIMRGPELKAEYDKFTQYKEKTRAQKQEAYAALNVQRIAYINQVVWIAPFAQPVKSVYVQVEQVAANQPAPGPTALTLGGSFFTTVDPGNTVTILDNTLFPKGKLAKMIVKQRVQTATQNSESRITGRSYRRHQTNSVSVFLGKNNSGDDFPDVVKAIKTLSGYTTFVTTKGNTISFIPEG